MREVTTEAEWEAAHDRVDELRRLFQLAKSTAEAEGYRAEAEALEAAKQRYQDRTMEDLRSARADDIARN